MRDENGAPYIPTFDEVVPDCANPETAVWRYMDLAKFVSMLSTKTLFLCRSDRFEDSHEGSITALMKRVNDESLDIPQDAFEQLGSFRRAVKEAAFVSCWQLSEAESYAMWQMYCKSTQGLAIQTTYGALRDSLPDGKFHLRPVRYIDFQTEGFPQSNYYYPFFHKRIEYRDEKEVRIVRIASDQLQFGLKSGVDPTEEAIQGLRKQHENADRVKQERGSGIALDWDPCDYLTGIIVHPGSPEWFFDVVNTILSEFAPSLSETVRWSSLKSEPLY